MKSCTREQGQGISIMFRVDISRIRADYLIALGNSSLLVCFEIKALEGVLTAFLKY